ncbi:MAG: hypothetical protein A2888_00740 [Chlamydiae bacterium RIFCSPLOWO2_01_FULL_28_7]|nr:MAG: hypothetical protein A2888_00740 [Chlamydiae bacterium RIFCSPLOWO2_01_FULL_28_7]
MKKTLLYLTLLPFVFFSCSNKSDTTNSDSSTSINNEQPKEESIANEAIIETTTVKANEAIAETTEVKANEQQVNTEVVAETKKTFQKPVAAIEKNIQEYSKSELKVMLDVQDRKILELTSLRTLERMDKGEPLTIGDLIKLSQSGISDEIAMNYLKQTRTTYNLTQSQVLRLQEGGVSQRIINYMIRSGK